MLLYGWACDLQGFKVSQGKVLTINRWGGILNHPLTAYLLRNICTKNYWNPTTIVEIIVVSWVVSFFWDTVYVRRCSLLLPTGQGGGLSVCVSVCHTSKPCKNGQTDRDAVWAEDSGGPRKPCIIWGSRSPHGKWQFFNGRCPIVKYRDTLWSFTEMAELIEMLFGSRARMCTRTGWPQFGLVEI